MGLFKKYEIQIKCTSLTVDLRLTMVYFMLESKMLYLKKKKDFIPSEATINMTVFQFNHPKHICLE